ncbi:1-aminocyclopropane-1-carboxylate synthase 6 [Gracilariopsis chorda]|uniref:1-aminocyclopropane-1-carboxylate synthase 6 n=1 Tax=Gracilariopsis chorda TaxID=448386 RepID=A0A2V3IYS0_9FLOR|nr:1-aminocyclopropane-1-carboxylate synthase 6 [Gracilariopsis chorda]|eukprot:PXF47249.1 1-aminocyclopropane-1-carboxylate synthase 6 [Gracilariopsis chorda]
MSLSTRGDVLNSNWAQTAERYEARRSRGGIYPTVSKTQPVENGESLPLVLEHVRRHPPLPIGELTYDIMHGSNRTRELLSEFLSTRILGSCIAADEIVVLDGTTTLVNVLALSLCEEGDTAIVTCERREESSFMFMYRAGVKTVFVPSINTQSGLTTESLEAAWQEAGGEHSHIKMLFITSVALFTTGSSKTTNDIIAWARSRGLHILADITALGVSKGVDSIRSSWEATTPADDFHMIWSASEFFGIPGISLSTLITRNEELFEIMSSSMAYFGSCSRQSQWTVQHLLSDSDFVDSYFPENEHNQRNT